MLSSPFLLPGGKKENKNGGEDGGGGAIGDMNTEDLTVGAVVPRGSPVVDSPVAILRGLNGLYLVSVQGGYGDAAVQPNFSWKPATC